MSEVDVVVTGAGRVEAGKAVPDAEVVAHCDACDRDAALTVRLGPAAVCVECMRRGLDASSVARYRLTESGALPWGKVTS